MKVYIHSRDELTVLNLEKIAYLQANGNYTEVQYIEGRRQTLSLGLSKVEKVIGMTIPKNKVSTFIRLGRSMIINSQYLYSINLLTQTLSLSDFGTNIHHLNVSKALLKQLKEHLNTNNNA